jgi:hypothetical protein
MKALPSRSGFWANPLRFEPVSKKRCPAFNPLPGSRVDRNSRLARNQRRGAWHFKGLVVSDCGRSWMYFPATIAGQVQLPEWPVSQRTRKASAGRMPFACFSSIQQSCPASALGVRCASIRSRWTHPLAGSFATRVSTILVSSTSATATGMRRSTVSMRRTASVGCCAAGCGTVGCCAVGCGTVVSVVTGSCRMITARVASRALAISGCAHGRTAASIPAIGRKATSAGISSSAAINEAMTAPTMAVAPAGPWAHAEEDAVVEIAWSVEPDGCARIGSVIVVAVGANRLNTDVDDDLRVSDGHHGHGSEQCSR